MISTHLIVWMSFAHWVADFVCQSDWMAQNKSKRFWPLYLHCLCYAIVMGVSFGFLTHSFHKGLVMYNLMLWSHLVVDYFTSRWNRYLWERKEVHWFFVFVGLDQFFHFYVIIWAMKRLTGI